MVKTLVRKVRRAFEVPPLTATEAVKWKEGGEGLVNGELLNRREGHKYEEEEEEEEVQR